MSDEIRATIVLLIAEAQEEKPNAFVDDTDLAAKLGLDTEKVQVHMDIWKIRVSRIRPIPWMGVRRCSHPRGTSWWRSSAKGGRGTMSRASASECDVAWREVVRIQMGMHLA